MCPPVVIVINVRSKHTAQMPLVEHNHMVECVAPNTADDPLTIGILPGISRGNLDFIDAHMTDSLLKLCTVDRVPVP